MAAIGLEDKVAVCSALARDAALTCAFLEAARIPAFACASPAELCESVAQGVGVVIVDEHSFEAPLVKRLTDVLKKQPTWSDIPIIVVAQDVNATDEVLGALGDVTNVVVLERPMRRRTALTVVNTALRARRRQYHTRDLLALAEADRRKNEFLAMLGHELRNPLAAIKAAHAVLRRVSPAEARSERPHEIIERQLTNLTCIVDDLLDVSRIISGKLTLHFERTDLNEIVRRAIAAATPKLRAREQSLFVSLEPSPAPVLGDPVRLEQIIGNLLHNAVKYTPAKGAVEIYVRSVGGAFSVGVRDSGCGIAPEFLPKVFDPFVQETSSIARSQGGLGLGLPLVRGLTELHGGTVTASSEGTDKGALFVVTLPEARREPAREAAREHARNGSRDAFEGRRVLLVDDNQDLVDMFKEYLELNGCDVDVALDGKEGIDHALARCPDIALVDIGLPIVDGYEVARRLRASTETTGIYLVAVSGYGQVEDQRRAIDAGFDNHLVKPVDVVQLARLFAGVPRVSKRPEPT